MEGEGLQLQAPATDPQLPWDRVRRTIVVVDLVESVRLMEHHENAVIRYWRQFVADVCNDILPALDGKLVKSLGDGLLLTFGDTRSALAAAFAFHEWTRQRPIGQGLQGQLRVGIVAAEIVEDRLDVYGTGVNLAARLASQAQPGQTLLTLEASEEVTVGIDADVEDLGELYLKHLAQPVHCIACRPVGTTAAVLAAQRPFEDLRPTLAVVPLACRDAADPGNVIGDLVADEVTTLLSRCTEWRLISRLSAAAGTAHAHRAPDQIARTLGADYLCTGSYARSGDQVQLQVQLSRWPGGEVVWGSSGRARLSDILSGQSERIQTLGVEIAEAILGHGLETVSSTPLPQLRSHALMLGAMVLMHRARRSEFSRAVEVLDVLASRHPRAAQPHAWRAKWHVLRVVQGWTADPAEEGRLAMQAARQATDSEGRSSLALAMQGLVHTYLRNDFEAASRSYDEALTLNPHESLALLLRGTMHAFMGDGAQAYVQTQQSLRLSPLDPLRYFYLSLSASAAVAAQRYDEAIDLAQRSLQLNRLHCSTYRALAMAQSLAGQRDAATDTVHQLLRLDPAFTLTQFRARFPGRDAAPAFTDVLADALAQAGVPP